MTAQDPGRNPSPATKVPFTSEGEPRGTTSKYGDFQFASRQFGGFLPDLPDVRDQPLIPPVGNVMLRQTLSPTQDNPDSFVLVPRPSEPQKFILGTGDTRAWEVPIVDQRPSAGYLGYSSCVSCALASVLVYLESRQQTVPDPARLFLYYNARLLEGNEDNSEAGTGIRSAIKALGRFGVCPEGAWPYVGPAVTDRPHPDVYGIASPNREISYRRIFRLPKPGSIDISDLDLTPIRRALTNGHPVICGFTMYSSFKNAKSDGEVQLPVASDWDRPPDDDQYSVADQVAAFGHAAVIIGYYTDEATGEERFNLVNSWGENWGDHGHFTMPAAYLADAGLASDFWVVTSFAAIHPDGAPAINPETGEAEV